MIAEKRELFFSFVFKDYGYNLTTLPIIIGQSGSQSHTTSDSLAKIGIQHRPASKVGPKLPLAF